MKLAEPQPRRFTREEYYRLAENGYFNGQHVQLIDGEIIEMPRQAHSHAHAYLQAIQFLNRAFGTERIRPQLPLNVPGESDPEPDVAVTEYPHGHYKDHPTSAILVTEIADGSVSLDRRKAGLYAAAGVPEYWIVNLGGRKIEVFRQPIADRSIEFGFRYSENFEILEDGEIAPAAKPAATIQVKEFFY
jgi:Uma2 family endonuclease